MQGTAADIIKIAMIAVHDWIGDANNQHKMVMQVHDELVFEIHTEQLSQAIDSIRSIMQEAANMSVPLVVDVGAGENWALAH